MERMLHGVVEKAVHRVEAERRRGGHGVERMLHGVAARNIAVAKVLHRVEVERRRGGQILLSAVFFFGLRSARLLFLREVH